MTEDHSVVYNTNFNRLLSRCESEKLGDFIDERPKIKSLIYFLNEQYETEILEIFSNHITIDSVVNKDNFEELSKDQFSLIKSVIEPINLKNYRGPSHPNQHHTKSSIEKANKSKDKNGKLAEKLVWKLLFSKVSNLKWTSENSDIPSERNSSTVFDMEYIQDGRKKYIEVKAASNSFFMSKSEYEFGTNNKENYELYLVDLAKKRVDGPHKIDEFEMLKNPTEYQFTFEKNY